MFSRSIVSPKPLNPAGFRGGGCGVPVFQGSCDEAVSAAARAAQP